MKILNILLSSLAILFTLHCTASGEDFQVVGNEWLWFSSNLEKTNRSFDSMRNSIIERQYSPLGNFTYDRHFERNGKPPAYGFLQLLNKDVQMARIEGKDIVFLKSGIRLPLKTDLIPSGADPASPYLMETPDLRMVLVVYPYYSYGCKDNDHIVEIYSEEGSFLHQFDSLPTHAVKNNPQLLVSPERSGCCDSLKWSMRFYDLNTGKVSSYSCPEGACGDTLFIDLERDGSFFVGLEVIGYLSGVGAFIQTNIYILNDEGLPLASGKIIHVLRSPSINNRNIQHISPFSISKLYSVEPIKGKGGNMWLLEFKDEDTRNDFVINGNNQATTPAVVFLEPKNFGQKEIIELNNQEIGALPTIVVCESGSYKIYGKMSKMMNRIEVQSDAINKIFF